MPPSQEEPFIKVIEEDDGNKTKTQTYTDFRPKTTLQDVKPRLVIIFFWATVIISSLFCIAFLYLIIFTKKEPPTYFIGFVGAIIGFFLAKRPDEIQ